MERKIGEEFDFEDKRLKVVEVDEHDCKGCFFMGNCMGFKVAPTAGNCICRKDGRFVIFKDVTETPEENDTDKIDLRVILRNCPKGEMFWSPMLDAVGFLACGEEQIDVITKNGETWNINPDGTITIGSVTSPECMLFPSKEQRDWSLVHYDMPIEKLPKSWTEFCKTYEVKKGECSIDNWSRIDYMDGHQRKPDIDRNVLPSKEEAEAHLALMQLHQLRDCWRQGWKPEDGKTVYAIIQRLNGEYAVNSYDFISRFLQFQDRKRAEKFLDCFRDLIKLAGDLI